MIASKFADANNDAEANNAIVRASFIKFVFKNTM
jgi:hypothetical protein